MLLAALALVSLTGCQIVVGIREREVKEYVEAGIRDKSTLGHGRGASDAEEAEEPQLSGTLKLQVFTNESENHNDAWTNVVTAFEEVTGVKVTLLMGSQVNTQYSSAWLAGEAPADIVWISGNGIADEEMEKSGMFYDLTELLEEGTIYGTTAKISDRLNMKVIKEYEGRKYRAPIMNAAMGMWYNKDLVAEAPVNFEEFKAVSEQLKGQGIAGMTYTGIYSEYAMSALILPAVAACDEEFYSSIISGDPKAFQDQRFMDVMRRFEEYCRAGNILTGSVSADHTSSQLNWLNGKAGVIPNGLWLEAEMKEYIPSGFQMAFCASPLITAEQKPTAIISGANIAVASKTENLENALAFVRFLYREDIQLEYMSKYGYMSALSTIDYSEAELSEVARQILDYINSDQVEKVSNNVTTDSFINNTFKSVINDIASGNMTAEEACSALKASAER